MKNVLSRVHYSDNLQKLVSLALYTVYHIYLHVHSSDQIYFFFLLLSQITAYLTIISTTIIIQNISTTALKVCECVWMGVFVCVEVCL